MKKWSVRRRLVVGLSICLILFVLIEYMLMTETVQMKHGQQVLFEERSMRQPWNQQSWKHVQAEADRLEANYVSFETKGFFGVAYTKRFAAHASLTIGDGQEVVTLTVP